VTTILLARHGETDWNREGRYQGWADPSLNELGRQQARALSAQLRDEAVDAVYSSDLRRARETALIVAEPHGVPVVADPGLREVDVGSWSGLTRAQIEERFPGAAHHNGETREQHLARVVEAVARIARLHPRGRIVIVSHGGSLRALRRHAVDEPVHPIENCGVFELHFREERFVAPAERRV